jgi:hypothetical protein
MKLDGGIVPNLEAALASARRFRGRPVYPDTIRHWTEVLGQARYLLEMGNIPEMGTILRLSDELETELKLRG